jgi:hypothetical protein
MTEMDPFSAYSPVHFLIWFLAAKYTKLSWKWFFVLSIAWELFEMIASFYSDFSFYHESNINRLADIIFNVAGFYFGRK